MSVTQALAWIKEDSSSNSVCIVLYQNAVKEAAANRIDAFTSLIVIYYIFVLSLREDSIVAIFVSNRALKIS